MAVHLVGRLEWMKFIVAKDDDSWFLITGEKLLMVVCEVRAAVAGYNGFEETWDNPHDCVRVVFEELLSLIRPLGEVSAFCFADVDAKESHVCLVVNLEVHQWGLRVVH